jgi:hypothetical protein
VEKKFYDDMEKKLYELSVKIQDETLASGESIRIGRKDGCIVDRRLVDGELVDTVVKAAEDVEKGLDEMFSEHNSDSVEEIDQFIKNRI